MQHSYTFAQWRPWGGDLYHLSLFRHIWSLLQYNAHSLHWSFLGIERSAKRQRPGRHCWNCYSNWSHEDLVIVWSLTQHAWRVKIPINLVLWAAQLENIYFWIQSMRGKTALILHILSLALSIVLHYFPEYYEEWLRFHEMSSTAGTFDELCSISKQHPLAWAKLWCRDVNSIERPNHHIMLLVWFKLP